VEKIGHVPLISRGPDMDDDQFYRNRARVLRDLANEADPLIKRRLLRLASNYDDMTTLRDQAEKKPKPNSIGDSRGSN
jgi:hypothetical protein